MRTEFFMPMLPPTKTHQEKQWKIVNDKVIFYEPAELKATRTKLQAHLAGHVPVEKYTGAVRLVTKWWTDDALVASEIIEKFWAQVPGIYIAIEEV